MQGRRGAIGEVTFPSGEERPALGLGTWRLGEDPARAAAEVRSLRLALDIGYRVFEDAEGRMNLSLLEHGGGLLLVPQFTLAADTSKGMRPSFTSAAPPETGRALFDYTVRRARSQLGDRVATGRFGAHMRVSLTNDGPVTFWLRATSPAGGG